MPLFPLRQLWHLREDQRVRFVEVYRTEWLRWGLVSLNVSYLSWVDGLDEDKNLEGSLHAVDAPPRSCIQTRCTTYELVPAVWPRKRQEFALAIDLRSVKVAEQSVWCVIERASAKSWACLLLLLLQYHHPRSSYQFLLSHNHNFNLKNGHSSPPIPTSAHEHGSVSSASRSVCNRPSTR